MIPGCLALCGMWKFRGPSLRLDRCMTPNWTIRRGRGVRFVLPPLGVRLGVALRSGSVPWTDGVVCRRGSCASAAGALFVGGCVVLLQQCALVGRFGVLCDGLGVLSDERSGRARWGDARTFAPPPQPE